MINKNYKLKALASIGKSAFLGIEKQKQKNQLKQSCRFYHGKFTHLIEGTLMQI